MPDPKSSDTFEGARRRVESGDLSFEAVAAMCNAHAKTLVNNQCVVDLLPWAEDVPPWSGPKQAPEERGRLYAEPGAMGSTILWFGRDRRHHAVTIYPPERVGNVFRLAGRLWRVRRLSSSPPEAA